MPNPAPLTAAQRIVNEWHRKHAPNPNWRLWSANDLVADIAIALAAEREACATLALEMFESVDSRGRMSNPQRHKWEAGRKIARAIWARSDA